MTTESGDPEKGPVEESRLDGVRGFRVSGISPGHRSPHDVHRIGSSQADLLTCEHQWDFSHTTYEPIAHVMNSSPSLVT